MYGIYANIWGILMGSMLPYIAYMDPRGNIAILFRVNYLKVSLRCHFLDASCPFFFQRFLLVVRTRLHWLSLVVLGRFFSDQPRLVFLIFHFIYGLSSFPLTNSYFSRWLFKPPSSHDWEKVLPGGLFL